MKEIRKILSYVKPYRKNVAMLFTFNILTAIFSLISFGAIVPFLKILFGEAKGSNAEIDENSALSKVNSAINDFLGSVPVLDALLYICIGLVSVYLLKNVFRYLGLSQMVLLRNSVIHDIRQKLNNKILKLPLSFFGKGKKGDLLSRFTNDVLEIDWAVAGVVEMIFRDPPTVILTLGMLFFINWKLTLFVLILIPLSGFIISRIGKYIKKGSRVSQKQLGQVVAGFEENIGGIRIIRAFEAEQKRKDEFDNTNRGYKRTMMRIQRRQFLGSPINETLGVLTISVILGYGGHLVLSNQLNGEFLIMYLGVFYQLIPPSKSIGEAFFRAQKGSAAAERIDEILDQDEVIFDPPNGKNKSDFTESLKLANVHFAYDKKPVLKDINLQIKKGEKIALVGPSGGGKSTLIHLVARYYDTQKGLISIDGVNIKEIVLSDLRSMFGLVSQDAILFNDSVLNNIALGDSTPNREKAIEAAKTANAWGFVEKLAEGIDTSIGDGGNLLSGGQKQRLTIARALYRNAPILLLDEATSALDTESERLVQEALEKLMENRTIIMIAHRLSSIKQADRIAVLEAGEIVEMGSHEELINNNKMYKKLHAMQDLN